MQVFGLHVPRRTGQRTLPLPAHHCGDLALLRLALRRRNRGIVGLQLMCRRRNNYDKQRFARPGAIHVPGQVTLDWEEANHYEKTFDSIGIRIVLGGCKRLPYL